MDQKEIDALINKGSVAEFNKKQEELLKNLSEHPVAQAEEVPVPPPVEHTAPEPPTPPAPAPAPVAKEEEGPFDSPKSKGKVMGQLSRVTEESEAGTNMVMGYLENVLTVVSRQQSFIKDISTVYKDNPTSIDMNEVFGFLTDNVNSIEEQIFSAMDAFQFQDIGRQKLMKVMYTLAKLNEYLNELLGGETEKTKTFGHKIEKKTMEKDQDKDHVESVIASFKQDGDSLSHEVSEPAPTPATESMDDVDSIVAQFKQEKAPSPPAPADTEPVDDVDSIVAQFKQQQAPAPPPPPAPKPSTESSSNSSVMSNDDIESLIAQYQNKE